MAYFDIPKDVMAQMDTFRMFGTGRMSEAEILGVEVGCLWVFGARHAPSLRPFDTSFCAFLRGSGIERALVLADPDEYVVYGLAMKTSKEVADKAVDMLNQAGAGFCVIGVEVEGWQVYEA